MKQLHPILLLFLVITTCYSQNDCEYQTSVPDELTTGRYKPDGFNYGNPYTMFNKRKQSWSLEGDLSEVRRLIISSVKDNNAYGYAALYLAIYENAKSSRPGICGWSEQECPYAKWVKNNAIVHLIGIKHTKKN